MLSQGPEIPIPRGRRPPPLPPPSRICQQARASAHACPVAQAPRHARPRGASLTRHCCGAPGGGRASGGWLACQFIPSANSRWARVSGKAGCKGRGSQKSMFVKQV